jgi:hypothetical protein
MCFGRQKQKSASKALVCRLYGGPNLLSFQTPIFWRGRGFELTSGYKQSLTRMFPMGYIKA